jgi:hypothetical protein
MFCDPMILQQKIILFFKLVYVNKFNLDNLKFVTLKRHTPDKFDQFLEDNFLTGRAISMTLYMKITVTIVLVLREKSKYVVKKH